MAVDISQEKLDILCSYRLSVNDINSHGFLIDYKSMHDLHYEIH